MKGKDMAGWARYGLDKPSAPPEGGQFFVSPRGHFPMSLDTDYAG